MGYEVSARFPSQERRLRRRVRGAWGHDFRAQLALRAKTGTFGAPSYRTGTVPVIKKCHTHPVITDGENEQEICPGLLLLTS